MRNIKILVGAAVVVTSGVFVILASPDARAVTSFVDTFDGSPVTPQPWSSPDWDVSVHSRDDRGETLSSMHAGHGTDCAAPPATHPVSSFSDSVFSCRDHMMTALNSPSYGVTYLTPDHLVDFSSGEAVVSFDVSTLKTSTRDWWDLWITPYEDHLQLPGEDWYPDLQGPPRRGVHIKMAAFQGSRTGFVAQIFTETGARSVPGDTWNTYEQFLVPSAALRDTFELRISRGRLQFGMPDYGFWWINTPIADLGWDQGVVQIGHHSYNPTKDGWIPNALPNTWHWDNVSITPAVPFTILKSNRRAVSNATPMTFSAPAPANSMLRFAGFGTNIEFSINGGQTWTRAQAQRQRSPLDLSHYASYWTPVPVGTSEVLFRGGAGWSVRNASIWNRAATNAPPPAASTTSTTRPTATTTSLPATTTTTRPATTTTTQPATTTTRPSTTTTTLPTTTTTQPTSVPGFSFGGWTTSAAGISSTVARGGTVSIPVGVTATQTTSALVDVEVYDAQNRLVHQRFWDGRSFTAGVAQTFTTSWTVPANAPTGLYTVKVGVFRTGWASLYHWNNAAATVTVTTS